MIEHMAPFHSEREAALVQQLAAVARARKHTQAELAEVAGVGRPALSAWFNGHAPMPIPALVAICDHIGLPPDALVRMAQAQVGHEF